MFLIRAVTNTFFFGHEELQIQNWALPITPQQCRDMVQNRMCDKSRMTCTSDICTYETNPKPEYGWMREIITSVINCFTQRIAIKALDETATPFEGIKGKCPISDMYCTLINGIIIWSDNVIHRCPLRYIESGYFFKRDQILYTTSKINTSLSATATNLLFSLSRSSERICNISGYNTSQGLWLSKDLRVKNSNFGKATVDSALMESLTLADQDLSTYILDTNLHSVDHAQALANCFLLQNILNRLEHDEDTFHLIHDINGDEIITYTYHSNLYVPRCTKVLNIFPVSSPDVCFQDVPVIIPRAEGGNFTAFLTKTGIIR